VVFLAALVGMAAEEKARVVEHLRRHMAPTPRSWCGARTTPEASCTRWWTRGDPAGGFDVLAMHHPEGEVIISKVCLTSTRTTPCSAGPASAATWRHVHQKMEEVALD
jgi:nicotianamine synthase